MIISDSEEDERPFPDLYYKLLHQGRPAVDHDDGAASTQGMYTKRATLVPTQVPDDLAVTVVRGREGQSVLRASGCSVLGYPDALRLLKEKEKKTGGHASRTATESGKWSPATENLHSFLGMFCNTILILTSRSPNEAGIYEDGGFFSLFTADNYTVYMQFFANLRIDDAKGVVVKYAWSTLEKKASEFASSASMIATVRWSDLVHSRPH